MTESLFSLDELGVDLTPTINLSESDVFSRLIYLLESMKIELPNWLKYKLPFNDFDKPVVLWSPLLKAAHRKGSVYGEGSLDEFKQCLDQIIQPELKTFDERNKFWNYVSTLNNHGLFDSNSVTPLEKIEQGREIPKFKSGFSPIDLAINGCYQAVMILAGVPGSGKTRITLNLLSALSQNYPVWYFQTEIPKEIIHTEIAKVKPEKICKDTVIYCGNYNSTSILEKVKQNPDPNRIIIYDSPEIKNTTIDKIEYWERTAQELVALKMLSKMVVVTSQTQQSKSWEELNDYGLSGSADKFRYADIVLYIARFGNNLAIKTGKNRFGDKKESLTVYDYAKMKVEEDFINSMFEE